MINLSQRWAEKYMQAHPDVTIQVTGGGSGTGMAALLNGTTDVANLSRPAKPKEIEKAKAEGKELKEFKVAVDGLAVVVHKDNPVQELSLKQLMVIYTGQFNNWKDVGGKDEPILRYCRESNSGTYVFFKEHVLGDRDYAVDCQTLPGTAAVAEAVSRDAKGIGHGGVAYFLTRPDVKILAVKKDDASAAISPVDAQGKINFSAIRELNYPISRYLYVYTIGDPQGNLKAWLDWMLGAEGQKTVEEIGYVSLAK
jgi:phosphate transport system substrate-binding protein